MARHWTFGQKIGAGFAVTVGLTIAVGTVAVCALRSVVSSTDRVITRDAQLLIEMERLRAAGERNGSSARGFLLTREERFTDQMKEARSSFTAILQRLKQAADTEAGLSVLDAIERSAGEYNRAVESVVALRRTNADLEAVSTAFEEQVLPKRAQIDSHIAALVAQGERLLEAARTASAHTAFAAITLLTVIASAAVFFAALVAFFLTRTLGRQIGTAVGQVQSSSAELQAAANEQATGAKEQATAMSEITTTINELLATSRQIAESAQHVAQIAEQTAGASRTGEGTVDKATESVTGIRLQVDLIVNHMLELGRKSQQIGAVLEIVSELAEQTNILAINATIEAAGAGDAGKRFGVVADEIRGLADRVAGSAKEIRGLIDDVRSAVNTTVMATETGSKSVDAGSKQFGEVAAAFKQIAGLLNTTTEAAREIELSTKQQSTAVEQVNLAIVDIAQATRETAANSSETLQTASQLALLSEDLRRLVQAQESA